MQKLILLAGLCAIIADTCLAAQNLACVYQSTSDQIGANPFDILRDIDSQLCSQIIYSSLKPAPVSLSSYEKRKFQAFADLKQSNEELQTFLEVDLSTAGSQIFIPQNREIFIASVIEHLVAGNFDGLNIKWAAESNSSRPDIKQDFSSLIETLSGRLGQRQLSLSVSAAESDIDRSYDISALSNDVDFFYVMSFDVDQSSDDPAVFRNARAAMERFHLDGVPKEKLLMGIASYGYGAEQAIIPRYEQSNYSPEEVYFDSPETIEHKANFSSEYGGVIVKALNLDDFNGMGDDGNYPVIQRLHDKILE
ncbi:chitotriosidase-1-like [Syngnathus scovelli]|uniref:chitotriosidase-1-like n=1 Tax=Syngnathus scovelli TaxID=161590 RepID=UPI0035CC5088